MNGKAGKLHSAYCDFINAQRRLDPSMSEITEPAFFIPKIEAMGDSGITSYPPFDNFWLVFDIAGVQVAHVTAFPVLTSGRWKYAVSTYKLKDGEWFDVVIERMERFERLINNLIIQINEGRRVESEPSRLSAINRGRSKSKQGLSVIPPFITIKPRRVAEEVEVVEPTGIIRSPHSRRGHYRNLKSGKRVWVRDCRINGGAGQPRHYVVRT